MKPPQYMTIGPEHIGPSITAFGQHWSVGRLDGRSACGFIREDIGKLLYLVDGYLIPESEGDKPHRDSLVY